MRSPFDELEPEPRAVAAARALMARLPDLHEGKMFGVLVVEGAEPLAAFSADSPRETAPEGRVGERARESDPWPGFVPHVYDAAARARIEPQADAAVKALTARLAAVSLAERDAVAADFEAQRAVLRERHAARRAARRASAPNDDESRADKRERRQLEASARGALAQFAPLERRRAAIERLRAFVSREAMRRIHDTYVLENALGERTLLRALFTQGEPPWGAGECVAVKLLQHAIRQRLTPLALAEFWWGPAPLAGARVHGQFYPACRTKCGPVLPFLLRGLDVEPRRAWRSTPSRAEMLYEDARIAVLSKPAGLLSVPGKEESHCALEQLQARHPKARLVHRLDLDTSGVLLAALDEAAYLALQRQFLERSVEKRYVAWLDGDVREPRGTLSLPMRVDLEQRPRQLVDFEHGRAAVTDYEVLDRRDGRTRVAFFPRTGRTHQLRVHAAHAQGLGAAIVGDRLYGADGERLMLHAESLTFTHPDGQRVTHSTPAPF